MTLLRVARRCYDTRSLTRRRFNTIAVCPPSVCPCQSAPEGLDIDYKLPLNDTAPKYSEQVLISTGKRDWTSRIEEDETGALARQLKALLAPKGKYFNPYRNVIVTHSSFPLELDIESRADAASTSIILLPSFIHVPNISAANIDELVKGGLAEEAESTEERVQKLSRHLYGITELTEVLVLVCSHGGRDSRCGALGPVLHQEFQSQLAGAGFAVATDPSCRMNTEPASPQVAVASISHIGGHKWAGNVIIYVPPTMVNHPLAGKGVWYGRVMPQYVEGIINATIKRGDIIEQLFRGGIQPDRTALRIASSPTVTDVA